MSLLQPRLLHEHVYFDLWHVRTSDYLSTSMSASTMAPRINSSTPSLALLDPSRFPQFLFTSTIHVELTYSPLDATEILSKVRSPRCGANVLFLGTTRDSFEGRAVSKLSYSAYPALALKSFQSIAERAMEKHGLEKICIVHRLGHVPVGMESIAIAASAGHRAPSWRGAEEMLERCKERVEVWKMEVFANADGDRDLDEEEGLWRRNDERDAEGKTKMPMVEE